MTGIILAGGESSRMGKNKLFINIGGKPLIKRAIQDLRPWVNELLVVTKEARAYDFLPDSVRVIEDIYPGRGPLGGIHAGLVAMENEIGAVLACDMPFFSPQLLRYMSRKPPGWDVLVPQSKDGYLEPMHALYKKTCLPHIERLLEAKEEGAKIIEFYGQVKVQVVSEEEWKNFGHPDKIFFNVNTPADVDRAKKML